MGENEHSDNYREILNCDLEKIEYTLLKTWASYDRCIKKYEGAMKKSFDGNTPYFSEANLMKLHRNSKHKILTQVCCLLSCLLINSIQKNTFFLQNAIVFGGTKND